MSHVNTEGVPVGPEVEETPKHQGINTRTPVCIRAPSPLGATRFGPPALNIVQRGKTRAGFSRAFRSPAVAVAPPSAITSMYTSQLFAAVFQVFEAETTAIDVKTLKLTQ